MLNILRITSFVLFVVLSLCVTEIAVRFFNNREVGEARTDIIEAEYMPTRLRPFYDGEVMGVLLKTNQFGFREHFNLKKTAPPEEFRILALGDSVGLGLGVTAQEHYTGRLEAELNERTKQRRVEVVNAAGQGYSPSNYLAYLRHEGLEFAPDLVLVQIELCNDITDEALLRWETSSPSGTLQAVRGGRYVVSWDGNLLGSYTRGPFFFEKTYTYALLVRRMASLINSFNGNDPAATAHGTTYFFQDFEAPFLTPDRISLGWDRLIGALVQLHELTGEYNIPLRILVIPSRYMFEASRSQRRFAEELYRRAVDSLREHEVSVIEVFEELKEGGGTDLYLDFAHPTREGNRIVGAALAKELTNLIPVESLR